MDLPPCFQTRLRTVFDSFLVLSFVRPLSRLATKAQLDLLASLIISSFHSPLSPPSTAQPVVTLHSLTTSLLRLPSFYELPALRLSLLSSIELFTSAASSAPTLLSTRPYELLLVLPVEYIPRAQRLELVGRALRLEKALKITPGKEKNEREGGERARAVLRRFAANVGEEMSGNGGLVSGFVLPSHLFFLHLHSFEQLLTSSYRIFYYRTDHRRTRHRLLDDAVSLRRTSPVDFSSTRSRGGDFFASQQRFQVSSKPVFFFPSLFSNLSLTFRSTSSSFIQVYRQVRVARIARSSRRQSLPRGRPRTFRGRCSRSRGRHGG